MEIVLLSVRESFSLFLSLSSVKVMGLIRIQDCRYGLIVKVCKAVIGAGKIPFDWWIDE